MSLANENDPLEEMLSARSRARRRPRSADPLDAYLARERDAEIAFRIGGMAEPERVALANRLSRQLGVPAFLIDDNLDTYNRLHRTRVVSVDISHYPEIGAWMSNPRNAGVAADDTRALTRVADAHAGYAASSTPQNRNNLWGWARGLWQSAVSSSAIALHSMRQAQRDWGLMSSPMNDIEAFNEAGASFRRRPVQNNQSPAEMGADLAQRVRESSARLNRRNMGRIQAEQRRIEESTPDFEGNWWAQTAYSAADSLVQMLPGTALSVAVRSPAPALAMMGAQTGFGAYGKYRARGGTREEALIGGSLEGGVEVATELLPMGYLVERFGRIGMGRFLAEYLGRELPGELAATMAQDAVDTAIANPDATWSDYWSSRPNALMQTAVSTLMLSTVTAGASGAMGRFNRRQGHAIAAEAEAEHLDSLAEAALQSRTRQRDPEAFAELVNSLSGGASQDVYIPAQAVRTYLQSDMEADSDFWGKHSEQISEALISNGDVVLPIGDVMAHLPGTRAWDALRDDMRMSPGGYSPREAAEFERDFSGDLEQAAKSAVSRIEQEQASDAPRRAVEDAAYTKLVDAGFTPDAARVQAALWAARANARAERNGQAISGNEVDHITVNRVLPDALQPLRASDQLDLVIAAMRKGKNAQVRTAGPSLLEWISGRGGIEDTGGDIRSMGGDNWHKGKRFRRRLIRETARGQADAFTADKVSENDPETLFRDAISAGYFPELMGAQEERYNDKIDLQAFYDAIEEELRGVPRHARLAEIDHVRALADELSAMLDAEGADPARMTDAQIRAFVSQFSQEDASASGGYFQGNENGGARGRVRFEDGRAVIDLFEKSNLSTLLHETGHIWLEEMRADATRPDAAEQVRMDYEAVTAWFAEHGHAVGKDGEIPVEAHEMWARGVERFLMEGKSPSTALGKAMEAFRSWLLTVYEVVANLHTPINPEIRDVMARLIATDAEIAAASSEEATRQLFSDASAAGMTEEEFSRYQETVTAARGAAHDALLYRTMATVRTERTKEWRAHQDRVRAEVTDRVDARPEFRALAALQGGERLSKAWITENYGADALSAMPRTVPPIYAETGVRADDLAERTGFRSGDEMARALMGIEIRRKQLRENGDSRSVRQAEIDMETDRIMREHYGDILADGTIEREARELVHNDLQGEVIASELRALSKRRPSLRATPYALAKEWAARKVSEGIVSEYTSRAAVARFRRAAIRAGEAATRAILAQDIDTAFREKQAQMLNNALVAEASRRADEIEKAVDRMSRIARRRTLKSTAQEYLERAHALLENVELRPRTQVSIDRQGQFETWARQQEENGHDIVVPRSFETALGTTHWSRLTVEKLLGLDAAVSQILHLGRLKQKLIDGAEERAFEAVVHEAVDSAERLPQRATSDLISPDWRDRFKSGVASLDAALLKMETVFDWLDGKNSAGVFNRIAMRPIADAQGRANAMMQDYLHRLDTAMRRVDKARLAQWSDRIEVPELMNRETGNPFVMQRQELISIALNMGNAGNIQRLVDGYRWPREAIMSALNRELTAQEWAYVQEVWDIINELWPPIAAVERRVNGVEPEKVEAVPLETAHGILRGGYYPAVYDTARDYRASDLGEESDSLFSAKYTRATTRASSTKERSEVVKRPILLDLGIINRHVAEVIHDITHREAIINADRFLRDERIMKAVDQSLGPNIRKQFRPWLKHIANQWAEERAGNEGMLKFIKAARTNATVVGMGFRVTTMLTQIAGYSNSFEKVGVRWVAPAIARFARHPFRVGRFALERSSELRDRLDTIDRDIQAGIRRLAGKEDPATQAMRFAFHGIGLMDRAVSIPTWIGAYNKALAAGREEADAIYEADQAIRMSQGSGAAKDLAAVQRGTGRGGEALKLLTMFYSFFSAQYQRQRTLGRDVADAVRERNIRMTPELLARAWWLIVVPPVLSQIITGNGPDDDEDWAQWTFEQMLFNALGSFPVVRDIARPAYDAMMGRRSFGYQLSPVQRAGESMVNVARDIGNVAAGEPTRHAVRDSLEAAGYLTGMVPGQVAVAAQFLVDVGYGEQDPESISDWYEGLTKGRIKEAEAPPVH